MHQICDKKHYFFFNGMHLILKLTIMFYSREFVNNVWCIKILSPLEVQQMGKEGLNPTTCTRSHKLSNRSNKLSKSGNTCDDYMIRQDLRNSGNGIPSMGSLEY